jgi:uncharacterized metal-binding protein YceD (DUF177 family)
MIALMTRDADICPSSDGLAPLSLQRLLERFPQGVRVRFSVDKAQLTRLSENSVSLLEPLAVTLDFDGKSRLSLSFGASLGVDCMRCLKPLEKAMTLSPGIELFERAADADQAMLTDPDLDAVSSEDQRSLLELIEDEILLELGHGLTHIDCRPEFHHETGRLSPFKDLAKLMAMKKP